MLSSPLRPSVPSASLLRFLRSQSDSIHYLAPTCRRTNGEGLQYRRNASSWTCLDPAQSGTLPSKRRSSRSRPSLGLTTQTQSRAFSSHPVSYRNSSSSSRPLLRRLFDLRRSKANESKLNANRSSGPALIDEKTEPNFSIARGLAAKASNELRLRCTEFDSSGNVTLVNGEFKKSELIAKVSMTMSTCECQLNRLSMASFPETFARSTHRHCRISLFDRARF